MRILGLFGDGFGGFGGISRFNRELLEGLASLPEVRGISALGRTGAADTGPLPPKVSWRSPLGKPAFSAMAAAEAIRIRPDLLISGLVNLGPLAASLSRFRGVPLWSIGHGYEVWTPPGRMRALALESSRLVTVVSRFTRRKLLGWARLEPERVRVLPNTFDGAAFHPGPRPVELARRYGLETGPVLFSLGRLDAAEAYKGQDRVIRCLPLLVPAHPGIRYLVGGDGSDRSRLAEAALAAGVADRVVFAGRVPESEIADHYRLADVFVMPSTGEGFGIVYLEAAACATPVVAGNRDGSRDALRDGLFGELVDPLDPPDLAAGIGRALRRQRIAPPGLDAFSRASFRALLPGLLARAV